MLSPAVPQPKTLVSPTLVLKQQKGSCFDYAVLLTSLLIGVGYDAYCVCGYADQEVTLLNQMRKTCPLLKEESKVGWRWEELETTEVFDSLLSPPGNGKLHRGESPQIHGTSPSGPEQPILGSAGGETEGQSRRGETEEVGGGGGPHRSECQWW